MTGQTDEYIENETELSRVFIPLLYSYKGLSEEQQLSLKLEMQEEIAFQARFKKEQKALQAVKKIFQELIDSNTQLLQKMRDSQVPMDVFLKHCPNYEWFQKYPLSEQTQMKASLDLQALKNVLEAEIKDAIEYKSTLDEDVPYLLEAFFMEMDTYYHIEQKENERCLYKKLNPFLPKLARIVKILSPFLTQEFNVFFEFYKQLPAFRRDLGDLSQEEIIKNSKNIIDFIEVRCDEAKKLNESIRLKIKQYQSIKNVDLKNLSDDLLKIVDKINPIRDKKNASVKKLNESLKNSATEDETRLTILSYWGDFRSQFSEIYQATKQLEQINKFLDNLKMGENNKLPVEKSSSQLLSKKNIPEKEAVEVIPDLDNHFLPYTLQKEGKENKEDFLKYKKKQLAAWQMLIQERKAQQHIRLKNTKDYFNNFIVPKEMTLECASTLLCIQSKMSKYSQGIFNSFFKPDASYKPHTLKFEKIHTLITQIGGNIQWGKGGSHFKINLLDTLASCALKTVGGSYKPHETDAWALSAHELCRQAFAEAGITPERIEQAQKMQLNAKQEEKNGLSK